MRMTFGDARPHLAKVLGMTANDSRIKDYTNRAVERLMYEGKWLGTVCRYQVCTQDSCITWPRQIETIEAMAVCNVPTEIRNGWYEFLGNGVGIVDEDSGIGNQMIDRGEAVTFDDIVGLEKQIRVYADLAVDVGKTITFQGIDNNGNWILTNNGNTNGEVVTLVAPPAYAVTTHTGFWSAITAVTKEVTKGFVRVYEYDTVAPNGMRSLAIYEPDETRPAYRRSLIPCLPSGGDDCDEVTVEVRAKLRFIPITSDTDWLIIQHLDALKLAVMAIAKEENNLFDEAMAYWYGFVDPVSKQRRGGAIDLLRKQLQHYNGHGAVVPLRMAGGIWGAGNVPNIQ